MENHAKQGIGGVAKVIWTIIVLIIIAIILWLIFGKQSPVNIYGGGEGSQVAYVCPSGNNVSSTFSKDGDTATVTLANGNTMTLSRTKSADGGRYANADESVVLWDKGQSARITHDGVTETCINKADQAQVEANETAIKTTVEGFGKKLQMVSPMSPSASSTIASVYAPYVTPELLNEWTSNPTEAPGREVSSPWPDHIEITNVTPNGVTYSVEGEVVLMTSNEVEHGGNAGTVPVEMVMVKQDGNWQISSFDLEESGKSTAIQLQGNATTTESQPSGRSSALEHITEEAAGQIAVAEYGGTVTNVERGDYQGQLVWDVQLENSSKGKIEVKVNMATSEIVAEEQD